MQNIKDKLLKILSFCNILDDSGNLSLTNLAFIAMVAKLVLTKNPDYATLGATVATVLNYMHKRNTNNENSGPKS